MRDELLEFLEKRGGMPVTPASVARSLDVDRRLVQDELTNLRIEGLVNVYVNSLGVTEYFYNGTPVEVEPMKSQPAKTRTAPYTANKIAGAYESKGNVVIKLRRRTNAKSITITRQDFDGIAAFFAGGRS